MKVCNEVNRAGVGAVEEHCGGVGALAHSLPLFTFSASTLHLSLHHFCLFLLSTTSTQQHCKIRFPVSPHKKTQLTYGTCRALIRIQLKCDPQVSQVVRPVCLPNSCISRVLLIVWQRGEMGFWLGCGVRNAVTGSFRKHFLSLTMAVILIIICFVSLNVAF